MTNETIQEQIKVGTKLRTSVASPWTGRDGSRGKEVTTAIVRVTAVFPTRFEYVVEEIESVVDPLPGTTGKGWTSGGMAFFAVGRVRPVEIVEA